jgi:hypothetical protein
MELEVDDSTGEEIEIALEELWLRDPLPAVRSHVARRGPNPVAVTRRLRRLQ